MEKIENLKSIIKNNLIKYRKEAGLTQAALAKKLGYSDKTISKWEREEGVPDIYILKELADLYGVTVNDLISENKTPILKKVKTTLSSTNKLLIALISIGAVWAIVTSLYVIFDLTIQIQYSKLYIYAIPVTFIISTVFSSIWKKRLFLFISISCLIWSIAVALFISLPESTSHLPNIFIIPAPLQVITILVFLLEKNNKK